MSWVRPICLFFGMLAPLAASAADPQWIWSQAKANVEAAAGVVYFRKSIDLEKPEAAHLEITCDNHYLLYFNGRRLGTGSNWNERHHYDVTPLLRDGTNVIAVAGRNDSPGPAGLMVRVHMKSKAGESWHSTAADWKFFEGDPAPGWRMIEFDDAKWQAAAALGAYGKASPWGVAGSKAAATSKPVRVLGKGRRTDSGPFELEDGDRVVLLGSTYIERMQMHGYLETLLTILHPDRNLTFRNLGWSGDEVTGIARAVFGNQAAGFQRLQDDLIDAEPTAIIVCYGANEAHRGNAGLVVFEEDLATLLEVLEQTGAKIALLSPMSYENLGPPLPNPKAYNEKLRLYCESLERIAKERGHHYVDLYSRLASIQEVSARPAIRNVLTNNGIHLNEYGYWRTAARVARGLAAPKVDWKVDIHLADKSYDVTGAQVSDLRLENDRVEFSALDLHLPYSPPPAKSPRGAKLVAPHGIVRVRGLKSGSYGMQIDDQPTIMAEAAQWAAGVRINRGNYLHQAEKIREVIQEKNELYFHRYRPQNETYLFLFRKHEQGNNAVEIPQFDPLVEEKEAIIAKLRVPSMHRYRLVRLEKEDSKNE